MLPGWDSTVVSYSSFPPSSVRFAQRQNYKLKQAVTDLERLFPFIPPEEIIFPQALHVPLIKNPKAKEIFLFYFLCPPQGIPHPLLQKLTGDLPQSVLHLRVLTGSHSGRC